MIRWFYRVLGLFIAIRAFLRGPGAFVANRLRAQAHKGLARFMRP